MTCLNRQFMFAKTVSLTILSLAFVMLACGGLGQPAVDVSATVSAGVAATQQAEANLQATVSAAVVATQVAEQAGSEQPLPPTTGLPALSPVPDPQQVREVILDEIKGAIAQDLPLLQSLYAPAAVVIDHNGTPEDPTDDTLWQGWANIERRYQAFFAAGYSSLNLVDLSIQMTGDQATATHQGVVLDGTLYPDQGLYSLTKTNDRWLITSLEFGNRPGYQQLSAGEPSDEAPPVSQDDGLYDLQLGSQHRYEEPWGWDRGDPCKAWETGNFDDTKPDYRGFNVELMLTNNSTTKLPDAWPISFTTAAGKPVKACYYGYEGSGPAPGATSSVTFFTVVEKGDYVEKITFSLNDQTVQICLDGRGGWSRC